MTLSPDLGESYAGLTAHLTQALEMTELPHALDKLMNERLLFAITAR